MTFVFLHVDRTGGMSVRDWLARRFDYRAIRPVPHHSQGTVQPVSYPLDFNADLRAQNQQFVHNDMWKLVMGHWDAGILERIPGPVQVLTVLRHPAERAASLWRYICQEPMYGGMGVEARVLGMTDFLLMHQELWVHAMTWQLAGARWSNNKKVYQQALKNVQEFDFVGVTEMLDVFLPSLQPYLPSEQDAPLVVPTEGVRRLNGTTGDEVTVEFRKMVAEVSPLDVRLYNLAKARCEHAIQQSNVSQ